MKSLEFNYDKDTGIVTIKLDLHEELGPPMEDMDQFQGMANTVAALLSVLFKGSDHPDGLLDELLTHAKSLSHKESLS